MTVSASRNKKISPDARRAPWLRALARDPNVTSATRQPDWRATLTVPSVEQSETTITSTGLGQPATAAHRTESRVPGNKHSSFRAGITTDRRMWVGAPETRYM